MRVSKDKFFSMLEEGKVDNFTINGIKFFSEEGKFKQSKMSRDEKELYEQLSKTIKICNSLSNKKVKNSIAPKIASVIKEFESFYD